jgi:hypothetical protein
MKHRIVMSTLKWARRAFVLLSLSPLVSLPLTVSAADTAGKPQATQYKGLDQQAQSLKKEVMELNRDLLALEEELLFPASTQVAVFVSMDIGSLFELDAVEVKLDDKVVAHYLYTQREIEALRRGGVHRLYLGNLRVGKHELVAFFTGKGPHNRDYRRGATLEFEKQTEPRYIELQIKDVTRNLQPEFRVKEWQ